jgi:hypothetical protein
MRQQKGSVNRLHGAIRAFENRIVGLGVVGKECDAARNFIFAISISWGQAIIASDDV